MTFTLKIELGNDGVQSGDDMAAALRKAAAYFTGCSGEFERGESGHIADATGNTVGSWEVA